MLTKALKLLILFAAGFLLVLAADQLGFKVWRIKQGIDREIINAKLFLNGLGDSALKLAGVGEYLSVPIYFISEWLGWLIILFVVIVISRLIYAYIR